MALRVQVDAMIYRVAERFKSVQGEGVYAGTPMTFIRFVGCSVGKKVCNACDTDFDRPYVWRNGGAFSEHDLLTWAEPYRHLCLTGGEPLDQDLVPLIDGASEGRFFHIETSGTRSLSGLDPSYYRRQIHLCVSPKPGYLQEMIEAADEVKVIVPGLGSGDGWPTLEDALHWAERGKIVFLQPRNQRFELDRQNLLYVQDLVKEHPNLRMSVQLHKLLQVK
jgi:7-carboxy-7-deazaguanine synthase